MGAAERKAVKSHEDMKVPSIDGEMTNGSVLLEFKAANSRICAWKGRSLVCAAEALRLDLNLGIY